MPHSSEKLGSKDRGKCLGKILVFFKCSTFQREILCFFSVAFLEGSVMKSEIFWLEQVFPLSEARGWEKPFASSFHEET